MVDRRRCRAFAPASLPSTCTSTPSGTAGSWEHHSVTRPRSPLDWSESCRDINSSVVQSTSDHPRPPMKPRSASSPRKISTSRNRWPRICDSRCPDSRDVSAARYFDPVAVGETRKPIPFAVATSKGRDCARSTSQSSVLMATRPFTSPPKPGVILQLTVPRSSTERGARLESRTLRPRS